MDYKAQLEEAITYSTVWAVKELVAHFGEEDTFLDHALTDAVVGGLSYAPTRVRDIAEFALLALLERAATKAGKAVQHDKGE